MFRNTNRAKHNGIWWTLQEFQKNDTYRSKRDLWEKKKILKKFTTRVMIDNSFYLGNNMFVTR